MFSPSSASCAVSSRIGSPLASAPMRRSPSLPRTTSSSPRSGPVRPWFSSPTAPHPSPPVQPRGAGAEDDQAEEEPGEAEGDPSPDYLRGSALVARSRSGEPLGGDRLVLLGRLSVTGPLRGRSGKAKCGGFVSHAGRAVE